MRKYLLYAIGEIALVMIGILLALQVNNWNTDRIAQNKVKEYARALITDLEANKNTAIHRKMGMEVLKMRIDSLRNYTRGKSIEEISNLEVLCLSWQIQYPSFSWRRSTIDELKSSEGFRLIKNDSLLNLILTYDAFTDHLDEDYNKDIERSDIINNELSNIVNTNYQNMSALEEQVHIFLDVDREAFEFYESIEYNKAKDYPMSLLAVDINIIYSLINKLIAHHAAYTIRCKEMERMSIYTEKIQLMLKTEYLE